jgi:hypothetical protein
VSAKKRLSEQEIVENKKRANRKRLLRRLWVGENTLTEICEELALSEHEVLEFAAALGLGDRVEPECYLPSREEILLACARIRQGWSQAEREARRASAWCARIDIGQEK